MLEAAGGSPGSPPPPPSLGSSWATIGDDIHGQGDSSVTQTTTTSTSTSTTPSTNIDHPGEGTNNTTEQLLKIAQERYKAALEEEAAAVALVEQMEGLLAPLLAWRGSTASTTITTSSSPHGVNGSPRSSVSTPRLPTVTRGSAPPSVQISPRLGADSDDTTSVISTGSSRGSSVFARLYSTLRSEELLAAAESRASLAEAQTASLRVLLSEAASKLINIDASLADVDSRPRRSSSSPSVGGRSGKSRRSRRSRRTNASSSGGGSVDASRMQLAVLKIQMESALAVPQARTLNFRRPSSPPLYSPAGSESQPALAPSPAEFDDGSSSAGDSVSSTSSGSLLSVSMMTAPASASLSAATDARPRSSSGGLAGGTDMRHIWVRTWDAIAGAPIVVTLRRLWFDDDGGLGKDERLSCTPFWQKVLTSSMSAVRSLLYGLFIAPYVILSALFGRPGMAALPRPPRRRPVWDV